MVTEEVAREALLSFVSSKCCYGRSAARDLVIQQMKQQMLCRVRGRPWGPCAGKGPILGGCRVRASLGEGLCTG